MPIFSRSIASIAGKTIGVLTRSSPRSVGSGAGGNLAFFSTTPSNESPVDSSGFDTVACVGLGLMGHGICQVAATSGIHSQVVAFEQEQRFLDSGYVLCILRCCRECIPCRYENLTSSHSINGIAHYLLPTYF